MKKILYFLLCCTGVAFAADNMQYADPSKPIIVNVNQPTFSVRIKTNPTTGYNWLYDADHSSTLIQVIDKRYQVPDTKLVGAPGYDVWTFTVQKSAFTVPTVTRVTLLYTRPWEMKVANKIVLTVVTATSSA